MNGSPRSSRRLSGPQWVIAGSTFGALLVASLALGFAAGRAGTPKAKPAQVAAVPAKAKPVSIVKEGSVEPTLKPKKDADPAPGPIEPKKAEPKTESKTEPKVEPKPEPKTPAKTEPKKEFPPKKEVTPPKGEVITYVSKIRSIINNKCVVCHGDPSKKGGLDMKTFANMIKGGKGGVGIVPGKPDESRIWKSIEDGEMPPDDKPQLSEMEKKLIHDWIISGAKEK